MNDELKLMERDELSTALEPFENISHIDMEVGGIKRVHFDLEQVDNVPDVPVITLYGKKYPITSEALNEMAGVGGITQAYARKCPMDVLFYNLEYWWGPAGSGKARFLVKDDKVISCVEGHPMYVTNQQLLESVEKAIGTERILGYANPEIFKAHSVFAVIVNHSFEAVSGDPLFGGIEIQNSLNGAQSIEIAPFVYRQICANGMIVPESIGRFKRSNDENCNLWAQQATKSSLEKIESTFTRIRKLSEVELSKDPANTLQSLFLQFGLPTKTQEEIVGEASVLNDGAGPKSMYDLWNSITRVATHSPRLTTNSSRDLRKVAGHMVHEVSLCGHCGSLYGG
jgi:hypothetical protein